MVVVCVQATKRTSGSARVRVTVADATLKGVKRIAIIIAIANTWSATAWAEEPSQPPSPTLTRSIKLYDKRDFYSASIELAKVIDGTTGDDAANKQRAEFFVGKTYYQMGYYTASLWAFDRIVKAGASHRYHNATLKWLAALSRILGTEWIAPLVGTYDPSDLADPALDSVKSELAYLYALRHLRAGKQEDAIKLLETIPRGESPALYRARARRARLRARLPRRRSEGARRVGERAGRRGRRRRGARDRRVAAAREGVGQSDRGVREGRSQARARRAGGVAVIVGGAAQARRELRQRDRSRRVVALARVRRLRAARRAARRDRARVLGRGEGRRRAREAPREARGDRRRARAARRPRRGQ